MNSSGRLGAAYAREARAEIVTAFRTPQFIVPTIILPVMFYALFGVALAPRGHGVAGYLVATYAIFAAIGPAMFGFGAAVAADRAAQLIELKRTSPMPAGAYIVGKLAACIATASLAVSLIFIVAALTGVSMPAWRWVGILGLSMFSSVPFALIGLNLGLRLGSQGATACANLLFLVFSLLGGLWVPITQMPAWLGRIAWVLPSYHLGQLSLFASGRMPATHVLAHVEIVAAITILAGAGAWAAWRREEN